MVILFSLKLKVIIFLNMAWVCVERWYYIVLGKYIINEQYSIMFGAKYREKII